MKPLRSASVLLALGALLCAPEFAAAQGAQPQPTAAQPTAAQPTATQPKPVLTAAPRPTGAAPTAAPTAAAPTAAPTAAAPTAATAAQPTAQPTPTPVPTVTGPGRMPANPHAGQPGRQPRGPGQQGQQGQMPNDNIHSRFRNPNEGKTGTANEGEHTKEGGHEEHECPPPPINVWRGFLGVDNKVEPGLLWRHDDPNAKTCAEQAKNMPPPLLGALFNLALVVFVLGKYGKGAVTEGLAKRKKTIMHDIDAANELKTAASKRLTDYRKRLSQIEDRRQELHAEYRANWESEKKRILADAQEKAARMRKDAEFRVAQERRQAQADLLREAAEGALDAAEQLLAKRIQNADQDRLADEYLASLGTSLARKDGGAAAGKPS